MTTPRKSTDLSTSLEKIQEKKAGILSGIKDAVELDAKNNPGMHKKLLKALERIAGGTDQYYWNMAWQHVVPYVFRKITDLLENKISREEEEKKSKHSSDEKKNSPVPSLYHELYKRCTDYEKTLPREIRMRDYLEGLRDRIKEDEKLLSSASNVSGIPAGVQALQKLLKNIPQESKQLEESFKGVIQVLTKKCMKSSHAGGGYQEAFYKREFEKINRFMEGLEAKNALLTTSEASAKATIAAMPTTTTARATLSPSTFFATATTPPPGGPRHNYTTPTPPSTATKVEKTEKREEREKVPSPRRRGGGGGGPGGPSFD